MMILSSIVYVLPYLAKGGTEEHAYTLINSTASIHGVTLVGPEGGGAKRFEELGVNFIKLMDEGSPILKRVMEFRSVMKDLNFSGQMDVIHVHAGHELVALSKLFVPKVPIVFTVHGYAGKSSGFDYKLSAKISNRWADRVIVVSESEKETLLKVGLKEEKIRMIYNGVSNISKSLSKGTARKHLGLPGNGMPLVIGAMGRLVKEKGFHDLIKAFSYLVKKGSKALLVIIGEGKFKEELLNISAQLGLEDRVIFAGYIQNAKRLIPAFDLMVVPSYFEAFGLVVLEAMIERVAVVGSKVGGIPELIQDGVSGFLFSPGDTVEMSRYMQMLLEDNNLRDSVGSKGRERYEEHFTVETMTQRTLNVYRELE